MSINEIPYRTIILDDIKYKLVPVNEPKLQKEFLSILELSELTNYSINTIYSKKKYMTEGKHYFKPNNGKLLFDKSAIQFLIKGGEDGEGIYKERQPICLDNIFH